MLIKQRSLLVILQSMCCFSPASRFVAYYWTQIHLSKNREPVVNYKKSAFLSFFPLLFFKCCMALPKKKKRVNNWDTTSATNNQGRRQNRCDSSAKLFILFFCLFSREGATWSTPMRRVRNTPFTPTITREKKKQHQDGNHYLENDHNTVDLRQLER